MSKTREAPLQIVLVCTANRFRSPLAAAILSEQLADLPVDVQSRGLRDVGPLPALIQAHNAAEQYGSSLARHRARPLAPGELANADLVVAFQRSHMLAAIRNGGARPEVVFTLPELVRLLERGGERRPDARDYARSARSVVQLAALLRQALPAHKAGEIDDPLGKSDRVFRQTGREIHKLSIALAGQLRPAGGVNP